MYSKNKTVAIIPAKGLSSRLESKNIKKLNGKPLLAYTIETAQKWKGFSSIYVNSENKEILNIAEKYPACL